MATTTMTEWEKEHMSETLPDCLRTFVLNADAPGGYSEYGETLLDFTTFETLTEENGQTAVSVLKMDEPSPLPAGTFIRMFLFGEITDGVPVWEFEENGEPKNFRNFYINTGNARWFERRAKGTVNRWRHDYKCEEVIACLKDYPIRSIKTFAEGAYTFGECLDIAFRLAFRPRTVGKYSYSIRSFSDLDEKNSKLVYSNCTLYDVVTDIGRIIDAVPSMEITFENGTYNFELRFIDRYGLEGEVHDISYFDMFLNDATNVERDSSAGACISNVENLVVESTIFPAREGYTPEQTNLAKDKDIFQLPYPIEEVEEIRFYYQYKLIAKGEPNPKLYGYLTIYGSGEKIELGSSGYTAGSVAYENPVIVSKDDEKSSQFLTDKQYDSSVPFDKWRKCRVFLRNAEEYRYLPLSGSKTSPCQDNTIYYTRGDNTINLRAIYGKIAPWYSRYFNSMSTHYFENEFTKKPYEKPMNVGPNQFTMAVTYKAMLNGSIRGINSKMSSYTAFFNQQGQVIDIQSFGSAVNNYTKTMYGENRVACHFYKNIGRREMYADMPRVGSSVIDKKRGKRYVVTELSFTRKMNGGLILATLAESRAGKSRVIIAGNRQKCYAISSESIVDSMSNTHIICKMGVQRPFEGTSSTVIDKPYLFNAFTGVPHGTETQPSKVVLDITASELVNKQHVDIILSRMRLSVLMSFRMLTNSVVRIDDGKSQRYTDDNQQLKSIKFTYMARDDKVAEFTQMIEKDSYEILNHTTQVSWVEYGNLRINESLIDMSYFGNGDGLSEPLQLVLLHSRMRLNDNWKSHVGVARFNVSVIDDGSSLTFMPNITIPAPEHVGWAIVRGDKVILLDNFDVLTHNMVKVYYQVEVRD